jgi:hypothetical protein
LVHLTLKLSCGRDGAGDPSPHTKLIRGSLRVSAGVPEKVVLA